MNYSITSKDKYKYLYRPLFILLLFSFIMAIILKDLYNYDLIIFIKIFVGIYFGQSFLFIVPILFFYFNYFNHDKNILFTVNNLGESFIYQSKDFKKNISKNDIDKVIFYLSPTLFRKRQPLLFWDNYFYSEIVTKGKSYKISCLVINNLQDYINEEKIERRLIYFPIIKKREINIPKQLNFTDNTFEKFKFKFKDKTIDELKEIIKNKGNYQKDAVKAARLQLKNKSKLE